MKSRICGVLVILIGVLVVGSGAGVAGTSGKLDLSSPAAVDAYLKSIGVDPSTVVKQIGPLNYAGPSCPGVAWNCSTSTRVVQIASAGGQNTVDCSGKPAETTTATPGDQDCLVVQTAPAKGENHATCREQSDSPVVVQQCTITQDNVGGGNHADVHQDGDATSGDATTGEQDVRQFAHVKQDSDGGDNHVDIFQSGRQSLTTGATQHQDAHQAAFVEQSVTGSSNFSHVHQAQDQNASAGTTQQQNTEPAPVLTLGSDTFDFNCGTEKPISPNQCANVMQDGLDAPSGADNESYLFQAIGERATTTATGSTTQVQGQGTGGQEGDIHQDNPSNLGKNLIHAHEALAQRASSPTGSTNFHSQSQQTDPGCCGVGTQVGGAEVHLNLDEATTQSATEPLAFQFSTLKGDSRQVPGDESAALTAAASSTAFNNTCDIDQHARNNSGADHFNATASGPPCATLTLMTTCASGGEDAAAAAPSQTPPCISEETDGGPPLLAIASTPTAGADIPMPSYSEPAGFAPTG